MSTTYAGDPTNYPTSITIPSDTDLVRAAAFNPAYEGLADRTEFLYQRTGRNTGLIVIPAPAMYVSGTWSWGSSVMGWTQDSTGALVGVILDLGAALPSVCQIDTVGVRCQGAAGHTTTVPGTMPRITLLKQSAAGGAASILGAVDDPSGTIGAYEAAHTIALGSLAESYSAANAHRYYLAIAGEDGAHALGGFATFSYYVDVSYP